MCFRFVLDYIHVWTAYLYSSLSSVLFLFNAYDFQLYSEILPFDYIVLHVPRLVMHCSYC